MSLQPGHTTGAVPGPVPSPDYHYQVLRGDEAGVVARGLLAGVPVGRDGRRQPHHPQPPPFPLQRCPGLAGASASCADLRLGRPSQGLRWKLPRYVRAPWELVGSQELPPVARGIPARIHPAVFKVVHRVAQHHRLGRHRGFPRRHHLLGPREQTGAQDSHQGEQIDGHSHQVRLWSGGGRSHLPEGQAASGKTEGRSVTRRRRPGRRRKQNATPLTRISSLLPSTGILGSLSEGPTCSIRCSRSRAPITGVPSSTPLKSATCSGATSTRQDPRRKVERTKATTRRGRQGRGVPGGPQLLHDLRQTGGERLGSAPQAGAPGGLLGEGSGASLPRLVRQAHYLRPRRPPRLRTEPRKVPAHRRPCHRQR
jgi:hypothetical protein